MGTVTSITFDKESPNQDSIRKIAQNVYKNFESKLSAWNKDSEISRICEFAGSNISVKVSSDMVKVYEDAFRIADESGGAFNPLVGNVMKLWGFNGGKLPHCVPSDDDIAAIEFSMTDVNWTNGYIRLMKGGMSIDLGAIAKGEAVDFVYNEISKKYPNENLIIDLGGNLRVMGNKARKIGVRNPFRSGFAETVTLTNGEAIATSGNYERFVKIGGKRYAHILDGRTGYPVHGMAAVTVIAPTAALADALSTTLFILGVDEGKSFLKKFYPNVAALWIPDTPDSLKIIYSEKMKKRCD